MPRLSFKPDARFVRFIALGAIGSRAVVADLNALGHDMRPLENGATDTKLWRDVKRKRVRIPDLVCTSCGLRVESRAKTASKVAMSHSDTDAERAWDYGMVDRDVLAFPVVEERELRAWSRNGLAATTSSYEATEVTEWEPQPHVPYFTVADLRSVPTSGSTRKGVTEGSETTVEWDVIYSSRVGIVEKIDGPRVSVRRDADGHLYTWQNGRRLSVRVEQGDLVAQGQVLASALTPRTREEMRCPGDLRATGIAELLGSPERTQRFTGLKLARLRGDLAHMARAERIRTHPEEDLYVRLEAATYLVASHGTPPARALDVFLDSPDSQVQLEALLALVEAGSEAAVDHLGGVMLDAEAEFFLRSAAAWGLGQIGSPDVVPLLIDAFDADDVDLREDALDALTPITGPNRIPLAEAVTRRGAVVAAGAAEALRRAGSPTSELLGVLGEAVERRGAPLWESWLLGSLQSDSTEEILDTLQASTPEAHFAIRVVREFMQSWIAERWSLHPAAGSLHPDHP